MPSEKLILNLQIPIISEPLVSVPYMTFNRWLPIEENDAIISDEDDLKIKFWFDKSTTSASDLSNQVNVLVHKVYVDVEISNIDSKLLSYIQEMDPRTGPTDEQKEIHPQYTALGEKVYTSVLIKYNLMIQYFRDIKGQYWLEEYSIDVGRMKSMLLHFETKVKVENGDWFRWKPVMGDRITIQMINEDRYLKQGEWKNVKDFVTKNKRAPLIWNLIAGAEKLAGNGHSRSAITEAITALEVAIYEFAENPDAELIFQTDVKPRINVNSLKKYISHLGVSSSINYLLPIILSEEQLPRELLETCQNALVVRNNVVHNGQRDVDEKSLNKYVRSIREICSILQHFSTS